MYAPTEDKVDAEKEKFYDDLETVIDRTPKSDTILVLGDANAKLGKEDVYRGVSGKHTLHEISNRNWEMLLELALGNNLTVISTQFQHKKIHKGTWLAPDQMTLNQIDHILITTINVTTSFPFILTLKMQLASSFKTLLSTHIDTCHSQENHNVIVYK
jgi:hypothetical protein